ncbi:MAG: ceramide glucosyltransferase [Planctomycetes bacterium]|nr:ceramide glucosyltransferase [Planctomycetota bacterium]
MGTAFIALGLVWISIAFIVPAVLVLAQRAMLGREPVPRRGPAPAVSVLKPLRGVDAALESNLTTLFRQEFAEYEVLLGAADADDPSLDVARRVAAAHPHVPSRVIADARKVGRNPKVNNLANLARHARHEVLVVSDSNVSVAPDYLARLVARLEEPGVGLVTSPIRARPNRSLGASLESLQLNTYVMGGVGALTLWFNGVCCVGKSMAFRRRDLEAIGGFHFLGRHLAEDQVSGEELKRAGHVVTVESAPVDNVLGELGVRDFCARHLRWARIRRWMAPAAYAGEILSNPVAAAIVAFAVLPSATAACIAASIVAFRSACDASMEARLGIRRAVIAYPALLLLKESLTLALWPVPFVSRAVSWRGNRFLLGPRSVLQPMPRADVGAMLMPPDVVLDWDPEGDPVAATA